MVIPTHNYDKKFPLPGGPSNLVNCQSDSSKSNPIIVIRLVKFDEEHQNPSDFSSD